MTDSPTPRFRSNMGVQLVDSMASDDRVVQAARVSTQGHLAEEAEATPGFIGYLARNRHGSPFEHSVFTWLIDAPIFVWREIMRHRIASYNEESGRYKQLAPVFYLPAEDRALQQIGKPGHYQYVEGTGLQKLLVSRVHESTARTAYDGYLELLDAGVAREVARMTLPLNIYSSAYVTMNARALTNFLSLRTKVEGSTFPSYPQREIEMVAELMELDFMREMPMTHRAWVDAGRVAL